MVRSRLGASAAAGPPFDLVVVLPSVLEAAGIKWESFVGYCDQERHSIIVPNCARGPGGADEAAITASQRALGRHGQCRGLENETRSHPTQRIDRAVFVRRLRRRRALT